MMLENVHHDSVCNVRVHKGGNVVDGRWSMRSGINTTAVSSISVRT
jgi:hypothetical protein